MARSRRLNNSDPGPIGPDSDPAWVGRIQAKIVAWYDDAARPLPWREDRDPYRILVSEMMLVQTTVAAVIPYFHRFLDRFPTVTALAEAPETDVLKAWEGLGYYRRARQLQEAARVVVDRHDGVFPSDPDAVRALPGVGRYIAGAILSFAYDQPAPIVEANTQRVLARWLAWDEDLKTTRSQARLWEASARVVPQTGSGQFNQAFTELGALVCIPRNPMCLTCPVRTECRSRELGVQDRIPVATPKTPPREVAESCAVVIRDGQLLLLQRGRGRLWENFWEFPTIHRSGHDPAGRSVGEAITLQQGVRRLAGVDVAVGPVEQTVRFGVTTHKVTLEAHPATWIAGEPAPGPGFTAAAWVDLDAITTYPMSAPTRRLLAKWGTAGPSIDPGRVPLGRDDEPQNPKPSPPSA